MINSFKKIVKRIFKNDIINNERGSVLSVSLIVITVLTFTLASVTSENVNLAGQTTHQMNAIVDDSFAKGLINEKIAELENLIALDANSDYGQAVLDFDATFDSNDRREYSNGVVVYNETDTSGIGDGYGNEHISGYPTTSNTSVWNRSRVLKYTYLMPDGDLLVKFAYLSNFGSSVESFDPFEFSLATNGTLFLNSGYYYDVSIYGRNIITSDQAVYHNRYTDEMEVTYYGYSLKPWYDSGTKVYLGPDSDYKLCVSRRRPTNYCFTPNQNEEPIDINESRFSTYYADSWYSSEDKTIEGFFTNWDLDDIVSEVIANETPRIIEGDYTALPNEKFKNETVIVTGNLTFDGNKNVVRNATIIVYGDIVFNGPRLRAYKATFLSLGQTIIDFDEDASFYGWTTNNSTADDEPVITFLSKDNIIVRSINENHTAGRDGTNFDFMNAFFYTDESFYLDAVNSVLRIHGTIFAKANGDTTNPAFITNGVLTENLMLVNLASTSEEYESGVIINSFYGYVTDTGRENKYDDQYIRGSDRFIIEKLTDTQIQGRFEYFPEAEILVYGVGIYRVYTSEWILE